VTSSLTLLQPMNESSDSLRRCLLVAGSVGPERVPARPDRDDSRWFEPLHIRKDAASREAIAEQVLVGADVVVAPTWLTHRRALMPLGETRNARAWTQAAIRLAREGVELGLERREEAREAASDDAGDGESPRAPERPTPLVVAVLPALDEDPEPGTGRLLPRESATERDYRDQVGSVADAEPDAILVEGQRTSAESALAVDTSVATGLPTWAAAPRDVAAASDDGQLLARWAQGMELAGSTLLLLPAPATRSARVADDAEVPWGGLIDAAAIAKGGASEMARTWLDARAAAVGILDGAEGATLREARAAIDEVQQAALDAEDIAQDRWHMHVARAAGMAAGGVALWLGPESSRPLPQGFVWVTLDTAEWRRLPDDHYRLIVESMAETGSTVGPAELGRLLGDRGVLVIASESSPVSSEDLRLISIDADDAPSVAIYRREG
jgi:hypothetical protein